MNRHKLPSNDWANYNASAWGAEMAGMSYLLNQQAGIPRSAIRVKFIYILIAINVLSNHSYYITGPKVSLLAKQRRRYFYSHEK